MPFKKIRVKPRGSEFAVLPATQSFRAGTDDLRFINKTTEPVLLTLPVAAVQTAADANQVVAPGTHVDIQLNNTADDAFEYQVYMIKSRKSALGNSDPVLIIDN